MDKQNGPLKEEQNTRESILKAAINLFAKNGLHGVSVKDISEAAGTNTALLFYYFKSKTELYYSILQEARRDVAKGFARALEGEKDAITRLDEILAFSLENLQKKSDLARFAARELYGFGEIPKEDLREMFDSVIEPLKTILSQGVRDGVFRKLDIRLTAISILGLVHFFAANIFTSQSVSLDQIFQNIRQMVLNGVLKKA